MDMVKTKGDYITNDEQCISALASLQSRDISNWLYEYSELFNVVTYSTDSLPTLVDCNFEGQYFESISLFHAKYEQLLSIQP
jgi:hypothetical protein